MRKKAFLVTMEACTRVVVDVDDPCYKDKAEDIARSNIASNLKGYLDLADMKEDMEMPYDENYDTPKGQDNDAPVVPDKDTHITQIIQSLSSTYPFITTDETIANNLRCALEKMYGICDVKCVSYPLPEDHNEEALDAMLTMGLSLHEADYVHSKIVEGTDNRKLIGRFIDWCREQYENDRDTEIDTFISCQKE